MKRSFFSIFCLGLLIFGPLGLEALEIEFTGGLNNLTFHPDRVKTAHGESANYRQFSGYPYGFGDFYLKNDISNDVFGVLGFSVHASRDNILRNSIGGSLFANTEFFRMEFGLFLGAGDRLEIPNAGITGSLEFMYPGIFFLSVNGSSTLGAQFDFTGNNSRESFEFKLGFWLPNVIPAFSISTKNYTDHPEDSIVIYDELVRFHFDVDIFAKNFPVVFRVNVGYEILKRSYRREDSNITDELRAIYAGLEVKWQITKPVRIIAGFETPVSLWAVQPMQNPANIFSLYKFHGGFSYTFF
jgi:hypothetical protein